MVNVELVLTRWREIFVINLESGLDEGFMVSFHSRLTLSTLANGSGSLGTGSDVELALEILDVQPKGQVLLTKVGLEEVTEVSAIRRLFEDVVQAVHVALDATLLFTRLIGSVELLRQGNATMDLGICSANQGLGTILGSCLGIGITLDGRTVTMEIGGRTEGRRGHLVPLSNPLSFVCDFVNSLCSASELAVLLKRCGLEKGQFQYEENLR